MSEFQYNWAARSKQKTQFERRMNIAVQVVVTQARLLAKVKTGNLRSSIDGTVITEADGTVRGIIGTNVEYAPYIEFGWKHWKPGRGLPYLRPALFKNKNAIKKILTKA